jgi:hypothetical protein
MILLTAEKTRFSIFWNHPKGHDMLRVSLVVTIIGKLYSHLAGRIKVTENTSRSFAEESSRDWCRQKIHLFVSTQSAIVTAFW